MKLYAIRFPEKNVWYVGHEEGQGRVIKSISVDKNLNCVIGIGKEKNARALAGYLTAYSGNVTEVVAFERESKEVGTIATFQVPEEEIPEEEVSNDGNENKDAA